MMSSRLQMATLSSVDRVLSDVVFTIPLRAATTSDPLMILQFGDPGSVLIQ